MRVIKELEGYKGKKITILYRAFGSGFLMGTLQNVYLNDKFEYIFEIIPYRCRKCKTINLLNTDFVVYEDYQYFYIEYPNLSKYSYLELIGKSKYNKLYENKTFVGEYYRGGCIIKNEDNDNYTAFLMDLGEVDDKFNIQNGRAKFGLTSISEGMRYIDRYLDIK